MATPKYNIGDILLVSNYYDVIRPLCIGKIIIDKHGVSYMTHIDFQVDEDSLECIYDEEEYTFDDCASPFYTIIKKIGNIDD